MYLHLANILHGSVSPICFSGGTVRASLSLYNRSIYRSIENIYIHIYISSPCKHL